MLWTCLVCFVWVCDQLDPRGVEGFTNRQVHASVLVTSYPFVLTVFHREGDDLSDSSVLLALRLCSEWAMSCWCPGNQSPVGD